MPPERRLDSLEGLRFLSSLIIVAGHYIPYVVDTTLVGRSHLAVDLFFVISGIVIAERYTGRVDTGRQYLLFMTKRVARLYPLHLATLAFYVAVGGLFWSGVVQVAGPERYDAGQIVPNLLLVHAWFPSGVLSFNYVSWSISAEMFVYLLFPLLAWTIARGGLAAVAVLLAACIAVAEIGFDRPLTRLTWECGILRALPGFAFGVWLSRAAPWLSTRLPPARLRLLFPLVLAASLVFLIVPINQYVTLLLIWAMVALAFLCDRAGLTTLVSAAPLARRGELTYSLYLIHPVIATVLLAAVFPRLLGTGLDARLIAVAVALVVLYAASVASLRWFEQPLRRRIARWGDQNFGGTRIPAARPA